MNLSPSSNRRRIIAGTSLLGVAIGFLLEILPEASALSQTGIAVRGVIAVVFMLLMVAGVFGITQILRARADWLGLLGGAAVLIGQIAAVRIGVLLQLIALSESGVTSIPPNLIGLLFQSAPLVGLSIFRVGIFFPLGLIMLGIALIWARPVSWLFGLLLIIGGVLFPIGRVLGMDWAVIACNIILAAAFGLIGWQILTRREIWEKNPAVD